MNQPETVTSAHDPITEGMMKVLEAQREDYINEGHVSAETRIDRLQRGINALSKHQDQLVEKLQQGEELLPLILQEQLEFAFLLEYQCWLTSLQNQG